MEISFYKNNDVYNGDHIKNAPDLFYVINDYECISSKSFFNKNIIEVRELNRKQNASHRREGIFLAKGPNIKQNISLSDQSIYDIMPTILYLYGIDLPENIDGKIMYDIFNENYLN